MQWKSDRDGWYVTLIFAVTILLCSYNLFNGFGEDSDSIRELEHAYRTWQVHRLLPSRSWGFPLYEALSYTLINVFFPSLLPAKLFSLLLLLATVYYLFDLLRRLGLSSLLACLLCVLFVSNPLEIISGNSLIETSCSIFFLVLILRYFVITAIGKPLIRANYIWYGVLFGCAVLARPDNMLYFPALFLFLALRKEIHLPYILLAILVFSLVGILPFYLLQYPIFKSPEGGMSNNLPVVIKNLAAIFGVPLILLIAGGLILRFKTFKVILGNVFNIRNELTRFLMILVVLVLLRSWKLGDELEYSLLLWPVFILLLAMFIRELALVATRRSVLRAVIFCVIATLVPNVVQLYFFTEKNSVNYAFSVGLTTGVFGQEKERRKLNEEVFHHWQEVLRLASDSLRDKQLHYSEHLHYASCDTCLVLTTRHELDLYKRSRAATASDSTRERFVFTPAFNVSRGWRNFIQDNTIPEFSEHTLELH